MYCFKQFGFLYQSHFSRPLCRLYEKFIVTLWLKLMKSSEEKSEIDFKKRQITEVFKVGRGQWVTVNAGRLRRLLIPSQWRDRMGVNCPKCFHVKSFKCWGSNSIFTKGDNSIEDPKSTTFQKKKFWIEIWHKVCIIVMEG